MFSVLLMEMDLLIQDLRLNLFYMNNDVKRLELMEGYTDGSA